MEAAGQWSRRLPFWRREPDSAVLRFETGNLGLGGPQGRRGRGAGSQGDVRARLPPYFGQDGATLVLPSVDTQNRPLIDTSKPAIS